MKRNLLIHSMSEFSSITLPVLEAINAKTICEIGAEHGGHTKVLNEWLKSRNGTLISIDPKPSDDFLNWLPTTTTVKHISKNSQAAIPDVNTADAWFIDGDHNWYTVFNELTKIRELARKAKQPLLIFLHDVSWPWARRDLYYSPEHIPHKFRQPYTWDGGVTLDCPGVIQGGFRSHGAYAIAAQEGGPRNGVLTAIEDFLQLYPHEFCLVNIPAVFGLGILFDLNHPQANLIAAMVSPFHENALLKTLELNRLDNYLKVIQLQDHSSPIPTIEEGSPLAEPTVEENLLFVEPHYERFEKMALDMINILSDEQDHPDFWNVMKLLKTPEEKAELKLFSDYLSMLLAVPQNEQATKIISVLEAICLNYAGEVDMAKNKLIQLAEQHAHCPLVKSTFSRLLVTTCE